MKIKKVLPLFLALAITAALCPAATPAASAAAGDVDIYTAFGGQFREDVIAWAANAGYSTTTLSAAQVNDVEMISVNVPGNSQTAIKLSGTVDSLKGIELFTGLDVLECSGTAVTGTLDVSALTKLTNLSCGNTGVTGLVLTGLTNLTYLYCFDTDITEMDVSGLASLKTLACGNTGITELDLSGLSGLESLTCDGIGVTELDLTGLSTLKFLTCDGAGITGPLDLRGLSGLEHLSCNNTGVTELIGLSGLTGLKALECSDTNITELILDGFTNLETLVCTGLPLHSLNLATLSSLLPGTVYAGGGRYYPVTAKTVNLSGLKGFDVNRVVKDTSGKPGFSNAAFDETSGVLTILDTDKPATYLYHTGCFFVNDHINDDRIEFGIKFGDAPSPPPPPPPPPDPTPIPTDPTAAADPTLPANDGAVQVGYTEKEGTVTLGLTDSKIAEIIREAADDTVMFDLTGVEGAEAAILSADAAQAFGDADITVTLKLPCAAITLGPDALSALADAADDGGTPVKVAVFAVEEDELTPMQAAQVKGYDTVINVDVFVGEDKVDVPMTVSLPYTLKDGEDPKAVCVWHLDGKGVLTRLSGTYDKETGLVTFTVSHQSYYAIGYDPVALWVNAFSDLSERAWYYDAVAFVSYYGYVGGDGKGHFMPDATLTRAMFATLVWNLEGKPRSAAGGGRFTDVPFGAWYADAVQWAADSGIVQGAGDGTFNPQGTLTRQAMVTLLYNYAVYKGYDIPVYQEAEDGLRTAAWAEETARKLLEAGVLLGIDGGLTDNASRAEVAVLFRNFIRLVVGV